MAEEVTTEVAEQVDDQVIDNHVEEVVDETVEEPINEEVAEETTDEDNTEDTFNPDDMFGEDNSDLYKVGDYDLSKYKDSLGFEDPAKLQEIESVAKKYKEHGFTQEQVEFMLEERVDEASTEEESEELTAKDIRENLNKSLSTEEKRNYRAINSFVNDMFVGSELEGATKAIMGNPSLVKLMNIAYRKSLGGNGNLNPSVPRKPEKQIASMSIDQAYNILDKAMSDGKDMKQVVKEIKGKVTDQKGLQELLKVIGL